MSRGPLRLMLDLCSLASLALFLAAGRFWIRSGDWIDAIVWVSSNGSYHQIDSHRGVLHCKVATQCPWEKSSPEWIAMRYRDGTHGIVSVSPSVRWTQISVEGSGIPAIVDDLGGPSRWTSTSEIPYAVFAALILILPLARLWAALRRWLIRAGTQQKQRRSQLTEASSVSGGAITPSPTPLAPSTPPCSPHRRTAAAHPSNAPHNRRRSAACG